MGRLDKCNAFDAYPQPINSPTGRLDCFLFSLLLLCTRKQVQFVVRTVQLSGWYGTVRYIYCT